MFLFPSGTFFEIVPVLSEPSAKGRLIEAAERNGGSCDNILAVHAANYGFSSIKHKTAIIGTVERLKFSFVSVDFG